MKEEFLKIVIRSDGRISPRCLTENFFFNKGKIDLWNEFSYKTANLLHLSVSERVWCYQQDITDLPKCKCCDAVVMVVNYTKGKSLSKYCSAKCASGDTEVRTNAAKKRNNVVANQKREATMLNKYGVSFNSQRESVKKIISKPKVNSDALIYLDNKDWLIENYVTQNKTSTELGQYLQCDFSTVIAYLRKYDIPVNYHRNISAQERQMLSFLTSHGISCEQTNRSAITKELDIFIPDKQFAIELNGTYWHSYSKKETKKQINRHKQKYEECHENRISLYQFTDIEYKNKTSIVESMILNKVGISSKINARECSIVEINNQLYKDFCTENHINGYAKASIRLGLYKGHKLISVLSFNKSRFHKNIDWEIIRFCTTINHTVRGGFSKLLKYFIRKYGDSICTYSDNRYGSGNVYLTNGFEYQYTTNPGYQWTDTKILMGRYECQKSKLCNILGDRFDPNLTEHDNMFNNKFRRIWDAGHRFFVYKPS